MLAEEQSEKAMEEVKQDAYTGNGEWFSQPKAEELGGNNGERAK